MKPPIHAPDSPGTFLPDWLDHDHCQLPPCPEAQSITIHGHGQDIGAKGPTNCTVAEIR